MVLIALFTPSIYLIVLAIAIVSWTGMARLTRAEFLKIKEMEYVKAERAMGARNVGIMVKVILPNALPPLIVAIALNVGTAILFEAALSFLGLGDPNAYSWGYMIGSSREYIWDSWWTITFPGFAIFLTVLGVSLVGDGPERCSESQAERAMNQDSLLQVKGLSVDFSTRTGNVRVLNQLNLHLLPGEALGIVGESGCGKSMTALSIMRLVPEPPGNIVAGQILLNGTDVLQLTEREMEDIRGNEISMVFQEPMTSLNPVFTIGTQVSENIRRHQSTSSAQAKEKTLQMLEAVGIPAPKLRISQYPHELSGGMRQRVMIAMALSCQPSVLIADEPTTALDVTIQAQIFELLRDIQEEMGTSVILITHDMSVIAEFADRVAVMYAGRKIEEGLVRDIIDNPRHPYTQGPYQLRTGSQEGPRARTNRTQ